MMAGAFPHRVSFILTRQAVTYQGTITSTTTITIITFIQLKYGAQQGC